MPSDNLLSPLSAQEISTIVGNISDAAVSLGVGITVGCTAVNATVAGLRDWCGDKELTLALLERTGFQARQLKAAGVDVSDWYADDN